MNGLKKNSLTFLTLLFFYSCATQEQSFLYKGDFFQRGASRINEPYQLTIDISSEFYPCVSPDGRFIVYVSDKSGNLDLWLYDILSRNNYRITYHSSDDTMPSFSENGKKIIFVSYRQSGLGDLYKIDFDKVLKRCELGLDEETVLELLKDDGAEALTQDNKQEMEPVYYKNRYIFFVTQDKKGVKNIFKARDKLNAPQEQITFQGAISPCVSHDHRFLAYVDVSSQTNSRNHIFLLDLLTKERTQVTSGLSIEARPHFVNNNIILYASIKLDSNKDGKIDINDNPVLYSMDLSTKQERQLTPDNYISYHPVYAPVYKGVVIYTSTVFNNIDLWMLPLEGYIPDLKNYRDEVSLLRSLTDPYLKLLGYRNLLNDKGIDKDETSLQLARLCQQLGFPRAASDYLKNIPGSILSRIELILNKDLSPMDKINRLKELESSTNITEKEVQYIELNISQIYREQKSYASSIPLLENIIHTYTNKDEVLFTAFKDLSEDYLQFNEVEKIKEIMPQVTNYQDFQGKLEFQNKFIDSFIGKSADREAAYNSLLSLFKNDSDFYPNLLLHYASFLKNKKLKKALDLLRYVRVKSRDDYFKVQALYQFYEINPDENFLTEILSYNIQTDRAKEILFNKHLTLAKGYFQQGDYLQAREEYQKIISWDPTHAGALTGRLRCDFMLLDPDEDRYLLLVRKLDSSSPYDYISSYLKGYAYSLIYSYFYTEYKKALLREEPGLFRKIANLFKKNKPLYRSGYLHKLEKYFKSAEEDLKKAYRIRPNFIEVYLALGWLYQIHADIDKQNFTYYMENSIPFYQSALHFNNEEKNPEMEAMLCLNLANNYFSLKNYSQALQYYNKKLLYQKEFQNKQQEAFFYFHAAYSAWFMENDALADEYFQKSYASFLPLKEYAGCYRSLVFLAMIRKINNHHEESLKYYQEAVRLVDEFHLPFEKERLIREMGICYQNLNDSDTALKFLKKALEIIPKDKKLSWFKRPGFGLEFLGLSITLIPTRITMGASFASMGFTRRDEQKLLSTLISDTYQQYLDYKKAINYLLEKKKLMEEDKNFDATPYLYNNLGLLYFKLNQYDTARDYYLQANALLMKNKKLKDFQGLIINNLNLIEIAFQQKGTTLSEGTGNDLKKILDDSIQIAVNNRYNELLIKLYAAYGNLYLLQALGTPFSPVTLKNYFPDIRSNYKFFLTALDYYRKAKDMAQKTKMTLEQIRLNFNIALIYYYTKDFHTSEELFNKIYEDANKFLIKDLQWKARYYLVQLSEKLGRQPDYDQEYPPLLDSMKSMAKGYNYTINEDPVIERTYDEYIHYLIQHSRYEQALQYLEEKKNFKIREIFLSYPFDLKAKDAVVVKEMRDRENEIINLSLRAQVDLMKKFDTKKRWEYESKLEALYQQKTNSLHSLHSKDLSQLLYDIHHLKGKPLLHDLRFPVVMLHIFQTNLDLLIISHGSIKAMTRKIDPGEFKERMTRLVQKLSEGNDVTSEKEYFRQVFISPLNSAITNERTFTVIPDNILFHFPFTAFWPRKRVHYDISLTQWLLNQQKEMKEKKGAQVLDYKSPLNDLTREKIKKGPLSLQDLTTLWDQNLILHIPDGFEYSGQVNYRIYYNDKYSFSLNDLVQTNLGTVLLSFEKLPDAFDFSEQSFYTFLIPLYYTGARAVSMPFYNVKEKISDRFWENFYSFTNHDLSERYHLAGRSTGKQNNINPGFKILYGSFPSFEPSQKTQAYTRAPLAETQKNLMLLPAPSTNLPIESTNQGKDQEEYLIKIKTLMESNLPSGTILSQLQKFLVHPLPPETLDSLFSLVLDYYNGTGTNGSPFLTLYKCRKYDTSFNPLFQSSLKSNTAFLDFTFLGERLYCQVYRKDSKALISLDRKEFNDLFQNWLESIKENNEEDYRESRERLNWFLWNKIRDNLKGAEELVLFPDEKLFFLPWHSLISLTNNQTVHVKRSYGLNLKALSRRWQFQAYGIQKNSPGRVILDFSYKELSSLLTYFPQSSIKINPDHVTLGSSFNAFHCAMPALVSASNILLEHPTLEGIPVLEEVMKDKALDLVLLTKASFDYQHLNDALLRQMGSQEVIFCFWRNNDGAAAQFIDRFYHDLRDTESVQASFMRSLRTISKKYPSPLLYDNFILLE